jgi:hypothetical protein
LNQAAATSKKTLLNQRVAHTFDGLNPSGSVANNAETSEKVVLTAPPLSLPKQESAETTALPVAEIVSAKQEEPDAVNLSVEDIERVLNASVDQLKEKGMSAKVCEDILKRVKIFVNNWPKLNEKVKVKMSSLAQGEYFNL